MAQTDSLLGPGRGLIRVRSVDPNFSTGRHAYLSVCDYAFARLDALFDYDLVALTLAQGHLSLIDGHVLLDHINVRSFSGHLRRDGGHQYGPMNRIQHQTDIYETAGPESSIGIRYGRAQTHLT